MPILCIYLISVTSNVCSLAKPFIGCKPIFTFEPRPISHFMFLIRECLIFIKLFHIYEIKYVVSAPSFIHYKNVGFLRKFSLIIFQCHVTLPNKACPRLITRKSQPKCSVFFIPHPPSSFRIDNSSNYSK